jgi:hypothetical protein
VWDIASLGGTYTSIVGTLGNFSVTSAVFVAGLDGSRDSPAFASVIGMLLIAFPILIFSALLYASGPTLPSKPTTPSSGRCRICWRTCAVAWDWQ